jgi:hypothetical protein
LLAKLVANPLCEKFGGPCPRCGKYFVKRQERQQYCSRKCRSAITAAAATIKRAKSIRERKLKFAQASIRAYEQLRRRPAGKWEKWVATEATRLMRCSKRTDRIGDITQNFVAFNANPVNKCEGKLVLPKGEK